MCHPGQDNGVGEKEICKDSLQEINKITQKNGTDVESGRSKFRDEGVIPTVHAFNVLRAAFNDANLAADTSGFCAEALIVAIRSFSSPYWEIRNSACLAFTALVRRMIGFLNVQKRESARRALTGLEFFHRYVFVLYLVCTLCYGKQVINLCFPTLYSVNDILKDQVFWVS